MRLLFCCEPFKPSQPDPDYAREVAAAEEAGLSWNLIDFAELIAGNVPRALRRVESTEMPELAVYRGWMLRPSQCRDLYDGLAGWRILALDWRGVLRSKPRSRGSLSHSPLACTLRLVGAMR